ncbi:MAG TPA: hypothetical protein VHQ03_09980 [Candidatus Dormibacteraeota bacterium]|jgi:hypothetical protein|nr:hypothetical protein [Candidatus Dormibacteraeota bacterium]
MQRWVPVAPRQSRADGRAYACVYGSKAYVVDVATGGVRSFDLPAGSDLWQVADYGAAGVYIMQMSGLGGPGEGVWLLNPATGSLNFLRQVHQLWMVRDGHAWVARFNPVDKTPPGYSELAPANSVVSIDLATGAETEWFYQAGVYPWFLGLDSHGHPVVLLMDGTYLIDQPGSPGRLIDRGSGARGEPLGDGDRVWFGGPQGIFLYTVSSGFQKVFAHASDPSNPSFIEPAGYCL